MGRTLGVSGASIHFTAMSDYGARKRLVTIIRYDQPFDAGEHQWMYDDASFLADMLALGETVEDCVGSRHAKSPSRYLKASGSAHMDAPRR